MSNAKEQWLWGRRILHCLSIRGFSCLLMFLVAGMLLLLEPAWLLIRDGQVAINVSKKILSPDFWLTAPPSSLDLGESLSLPIYPLFLRVNNILLGELEGALLYSHLLLAIFCGGILCYILRKTIHPAYTAFSQTVSWLIAEPIFRCVMAEWVAYCLITVTFGLAILFFSIQQISTVDGAKRGILSERKAKLISCLLGITFCALVLTKSTFMLSVPLVVIIVSFETWHSQGKWCFYGFIIPLIIWFGLNVNRLGTLSPLPNTEIALLGMASQFSHAEVYDGDDTELRSFITYVNERKVPSPEGERGWIEQLGDNYNRGFNATNVWLVAEQYRRDRSIKPADFLRLVRAYYWRAIRAQPSRWLQYFQEGLLNSLFTIMMGIISLLILMRKSRIMPGQLLPLVRGASLILLLHILTIVFEAATNGWYPRYEMMTGSPVWFISLITAWVLYRLRNSRQHSVT